MRKKKVLLLTPRYPYQQSGGGLVKTNKIIEYLSASFDLKIFCLNTKIKDKKIDGNLIEIPLPYSVYKPSIKNLLRSYFIKLPLSVTRNKIDVCKDTVFDLLEWCDFVFVDHFIMYQYIPIDFNKPVYLHQHNAEYILWKRHSINERNIFKKVLLKIESIRVAKYEKEICLRSKVVFASSNDILKLISLGLCSSKFSKTYHLGDDSLLNYNIPNFKVVKNNITFLGNLTWGPNLDGLLWFLDEMWQSILDVKPNSKFNIVGQYNHEQLNRLSKYPDVVLHGFVENLNIVLGDTRVFISPLRYGSGMKVKNITAMYQGLPIVTTDVGAEGIDLIDGESAFIANNAKQFCNSIIHLLNDDDLCLSLASCARKLAETEYSWSSNMNNMLRVINGNS